MKKLIISLIILPFLSACNKQPAEIVAVLDYSAITNAEVVIKLNDTLTKHNLPQIETVEIKTDGEKKNIYFQLKNKELTIDDITAIKDAISSQAIDSKSLEIEYDGQYHGFAFYTKLMEKQKDIAPKGHYVADFDWNKARLSSSFLTAIDAHAKIARLNVPVKCEYKIPLIASEPIPNSNFTFVFPLADENVKLNKSRNQLIAMMNVRNTLVRRNVVHFDHTLKLPERLNTILESAPPDTLYITDNHFVIFLENIEVDMGYSFFSSADISNHPFKNSELQTECSKILQDMYPKLKVYKQEATPSFFISDVKINPQWLDNRK